MNHAPVCASLIAHAEVGLCSSLPDIFRGVRSCVVLQVGINEVKQDEMPTRSVVAIPYSLLGGTWRRLLGEGEWCYDSVLLLSIYLSCLRNQRMLTKKVH